MALDTQKAEAILDADFLRKLERLAIVARKVRLGVNKGERRSKRKGISVEFADYRDYVQGDDLRFIDWNIFGRLNALYLKLFEENNATHVFVTSELEEAIFLADNLLIMSNRPSQVKKEIRVDLGRPRDWSIATSERYLEIKAEALELLHEEALKASQSSGKVDIDLSGFTQPV
jgi:ABC-type taurine transport system ATPase subunit